MTFALRPLSLAALVAASFTLALASPGFAQDAMATDAMAPDAMHADAMAPATDVMAPMSDADFELCQQQAATVSFPEAMRAAMVACHGLHQGMDVMAAIDALGMDDDAMMATDAMAPAKP